MTTQNSYFINSDLQFHAKNPCNFGLTSNLDFVSEQINPSCGDLVIVGGNISDGVIQNLCFVGSGCVISIAMASKLTQKVVGMNFEQIRQLDEQFVTDLLGLDLGINRMQCGMLSILALRSGIKTRKSNIEKK